MPTAVLELPSTVAQADRLIALGLHELAGLSAGELCAAAERPPEPGTLLVLTSVPPSALAPLVARSGKPGFVVEDMTDVDAFGPIEPLPAGAVHALSGLDRGDDMAGWSPDEALPAIRDAGRTPLTLAEGLTWALQLPGVIERNHCFMTIGSRLRRPDGRLDARTPALWISNGTGRDGRARRDAPKVGWCWAGNRHTWLGFASAARRLPVR